MAKELITFTEETYYHAKSCPLAYKGPVFRLWHVVHKMPRLV